MHRRDFLRASLGSLAFAATAGPSLLSFAQVCPRTEPNLEGPFYRPGAPPTQAFADGTHGMILGGSVRDTRCRPLAGAVLEIWQADADGEYDLAGNRFRGILRTDADGRYGLHTVRPGHYRNGATYRPSHIHVKVHANGRPSLTTQLYFPGDPHNDSDPWFRSSLLVNVLPRGCHPRPATTRFDFVV